jgi:hypothetical protein
MDQVYSDVHNTYKNACGVGTITPGHLLCRLIGNIGLYRRMVCIFFSFDATAPSGPWLPHARGF